MTDKLNHATPDIRVCSHEEMLRENGFDLGTPISGSMKPMIRPRRDSVLFVPRGDALQKGDVVLYRHHGAAIMHRVLAVRPDRSYIIRGDNSLACELVRDEQIIAVMQGFYRDERYISKAYFPYRIYAWLWPKLHPLLMLYKRLRLIEGRIRRKIRKTNG